MLFLFDNVEAQNAVFVLHRAESDLFEVDLPLRELVKLETFAFADQVLDDGYLLFTQNKFVVGHLNRKLQLTLVVRVGVAVVVIVEYKWFAPGALGGKTLFLLGFCRWLRAWLIQ